VDGEVVREGIGVWCEVGETAPGLVSSSTAATLVPSMAL
jgi:hypothetical protein